MQNHSPCTILRLLISDSSIFCHYPEISDVRDVGSLNCAYRYWHTVWHYGALRRVLERDVLRVANGENSTDVQLSDDSLQQRCAFNTALLRGVIALLHEL